MVPVTVKAIALHSPKMILLAPCKCGTQSLYSAVGDYTGVPVKVGGAKQKSNPMWSWVAVSGLLEPAYAGYRRIQFARPVRDRFESLWRNKCRDPGTSGVAKIVRGMAPHELLEHIAAHWNENMHWTEQAVHYVPGTEVVNLRRMGSFIPLPQVAHTTSGPVPEYDVDRLYWLYAADDAFLAKWGIW